MSNAAPMLSKFRVTMSARSARSASIGCCSVSKTPGMWNGPNEPNGPIVSGR